MSVGFSRHRVAAAGLCMLLLMSRGEAAAQSECELRVGSGAVGGSLGLVGTDSTSGGPWTQSGSRSGKEVSAELSLPIMPGWGARIDYGRGHIAEGQVITRHLTAAIVHTKSRPGMLCGYVGAGGGLYQFDYAGRWARNRGVMGLAGIEVGVGERSGLAFEIQLHVINDNAEAPLQAGILFMAKPAVLFRVHF